MEPKKTNDPDELGGWRINGRLGEGGFGTVFLAEKGAQKAAIKVIRKEFVAEDDARARLATEAEVLSKLSDPSIGKILDSDLTGELPWIATEFINGPTLDDKVKYEGPLEEIAWFNLAANIFHAIISANELGIIHKDIKPSNIILGETGNKLIDFGIAHISGQTRSAVFGDREGSTPFSSPEHFTVKPNPKMDVFSTAATLAFAGKASSIWTGDNELQLMRSINDDEPNLDGLTENQVKFLTPLLEKNPSDRPSALDAHQSALGYIEYILGKSNKPKPLKGKSAFKKIITSRKSIVAAILIPVIATSAFVSLSSQKDTPESLGLIATPSAVTPSSQENILNDSTALPEVTQKSLSSSAECQLEYDRKGSNIASACLPSAKSGDVQSIFYIGQSYFKNQNYKEAEKWFLNGAKKNDLNSMRYLIETYTQVSNTAERDRWTKICADTSYGSSDTSPLKDIAYCKMMQGFILERAGSTKEAILYLTDSAEYGNGDAAAWLGLYYRGRDEKTKALKWLEKSAELGSSTGLNNLIGYADEIGDSQLARKWLLVSANDGNQVNMGVLAHTYYFEKDFTSAKKWAAKGMSYGDVLSTYVLGASNYDTGQKNEGKSLLLKAANKGNLSAIRKLGSIYRLDEKNFPESAIWYEKLAARNDFTGTYFYSVVLFAIGKDEESCTYNDKVLSLGNQAKKDGTYDPEIMDKFMSDAKSTSDNWCSKLYKKN
jgi:serine/threonine protein kinase